MICWKAKGEDVSSRLEMRDNEGDNIYSGSNKYVVQIYINKEMMLLRNITIELVTEDFIERIIPV
jgi:hypothetical protein